MQKSNEIDKKNITKLSSLQCTVGSELGKKRHERIFKKYFLQKPYRIIYWCMVYHISGTNYLKFRLHASVVRMHAETKSRPPCIMSKEHLESLIRNKFTTNKVLSYRPKDDDVSTFKNLLEKGTRPRQDHLVAATSWPSPEAKVTSVKWPASGRAEGLRRVPLFRRFPINNFLPFSSVQITRMTPALLYWQNIYLRRPRLDLNRVERWRFQISYWVHQIHLMNFLS